MQSQRSDMYIIAREYSKLFHFSHNVHNVLSNSYLLSIKYFSIPFFLVNLRSIISSGGSVYSNIYFPHINIQVNALFLSSRLLRNRLRRYASARVRRYCIILINHAKIPDVDTGSGCAAVYFRYKLIRTHILSLSLSIATRL